MELSLLDGIYAILLIAIVGGFILSRASRAFPHVEWLQYFRLPLREFSPEEKERRRRAGNRLAGLEMIGAGFILPVLYLFSTVLMFSGPGGIALLVVGVVSLCLIGLGIWVLVRNWGSSPQL